MTFFSHLILHFSVFFCSLSFFIYHVSVFCNVHRRAELRCFYLILIQFLHTPGRCCLIFLSFICLLFLPVVLFIFCCHFSLLFALFIFFFFVFFFHVLFVFLCAVFFYLSSLPFYSFSLYFLFLFVFFSFLFLGSFSSLCSFVPVFI